MSDLIKKIKIKKQDGTFTDYIPIGAEAQNVSTSDGDSVQLKLNKKPYYYNTVADMKADTKLKAGDMVKTLGYYSVNDGGNSTYKIKTTSSSYCEELSNELVAELIVNNEVNVKQFGAYGDNIHDDYNAFNNAITYCNNILIPTGKYKIGTTLTLNKNTNIYGNNSIRCWSGGSSSDTEIITDGIYAFTCLWDNVNNFKDLTFKGKGIYQPSGARIDRCEFYGTLGIEKTRVTTINECSFHNCSTAGVKKLVDSFIVNSYFYNNEIGIDLTDSNDNTIECNKIEWNGIGIKLYQSVFNNIVNNTFDRSTTYGITGTNITHLLVSNNRFERNLTNHISVSGTLMSITNNNMFAKNSEDDQSGSFLPEKAIAIDSADNSIINNNNVSVPAGGKLFNNYPSYQSNVNVGENFLNGLNTLNFTKNCGSFTSSTSAETTFRFQWDSLNYLSLNGFDVDVKNVRIVNGNNTNYNIPDVKIYKHVSSGLFIIFPIDSVATEYTVHVDFVITSKFKVQIPAS